MVSSIIIDIVTPKVLHEQRKLPPTEFALTLLVFSINFVDEKTVCTFACCKYNNYKELLELAKMQSKK